MTPTSLHRVSIRLYVAFSLLMALSAAASGLLLLYLARPFIGDLDSDRAVQATGLLFAGAGLAGAAAAVAGLAVGLRLAGRIRVIVKKAESLVPSSGTEGAPHATDELGVLDAALGRLTLSVDQFVRDSDILSRLPEGMLLLLPTSELVSFNATAEALLGLSLERFRGVPILSPTGVFPLGKGNEPLARLLGEAGVRQHTTRMGEVEVRSATDQELLLEITIQQREWGSGSTAIVLLLRDATEKQRIREEIRRADQLALLGGMAARVAHQIRTPLATMRGLLELLQADLELEGSSKDYMDRIIHAVDRQDQLVDNLLTLSQPEPESWQAVSLPDLIGDVLDVIPAAPRVHVHSEPGLPPAWGDAVRLSEVFMNLIQNALEATPADGVIDIRMEAGRAGWIRVSVHNTGAGIRAEHQDRIFQPFFTTKSRGTGLGLAIVRQIVEAHRGHVSVVSDGVSEATFVVDLPTASVPTVTFQEEPLRGEHG
jgi:signal transduction histidine kinase